MLRFRLLSTGLVPVGLLILLNGNIYAKILENRWKYHKNFFLSSLMMRPNKLEGLSLENLYSWVLEFEGKARANPIGGPFRCFLLGQAPGVTSKY
jgi:hypothetical protein